MVRRIDGGVVGWKKRVVGGGESLVEGSRRLVGGRGLRRVWKNWKWMCYFFNNWMCKGVFIKLSILDVFEGTASSTSILGREKEIIFSWRGCG